MGEGVRILAFAGDGGAGAVGLPDVVASIAGGDVAGFEEERGTGGIQLIGIRAVPALDVLHYVSAAAGAIGAPEFVIVKAVVGGEVEDAIDVAEVARSSIGVAAGLN